MFALQPAAVSNHRTLVRTFWNNTNDCLWLSKLRKTFVRLSQALPLKILDYNYLRHREALLHMKATPTPHRSPSGSFRGRGARFPSVPLALSPFLHSLPAGLWAEDVSGRGRLAVKWVCTLSLRPRYSLCLCWLLYLATLSRPSGQGSLLVAERWTVEQQA